jgi:hypothetical protein
LAIGYQIDGMMTLRGDRTFGHDSCGLALFKRELLNELGEGRMLSTVWKPVPAALRLPNRAVHSPHFYKSYVSGLKRVKLQALEFCPLGGCSQDNPSIK